MKLEQKYEILKRQKGSKYIYRCAWGTCNSDSRYYFQREDMQNVFFIPMPKPIKAKEKCLQWIKACNRPFEQLNVHNINQRHYICSKHFVGGFGPTEENQTPLTADTYCEQNTGRKRRFQRDTKIVISDKKKKTDGLISNHDKLDSKASSVEGHADYVPSIFPRRTLKRKRRDAARAHSAAAAKRRHVLHNEPGHGAEEPGSPSIPAIIIERVKEEVESSDVDLMEDRVIIKVESREDNSEAEQDIDTNTSADTPPQHCELLKIIGLGIYKQDKTQDENESGDPLESVVGAQTVVTSDQEHGEVTINDNAENISSAAQQQSESASFLQSELASSKATIRMLVMTTEGQKKKLDGAISMVSRVLCSDNLKKCPETLYYYTGIHDYRYFEVLFWKYIKPHLPEVHHVRVVQQEDMVLMVLVKLKLGLDDQDLAFRFGIHANSVSRVFVQYISVLSAVFAHMIINPDVKMINRRLPLVFRKFQKVKQTRFILDCIKVRIERPPAAEALTEARPNDSQQKSVKFLVGYTPTGAICFLSKAWGDSWSDVEILKQSKFHDLLSPGDVVLLCSGFTASDNILDTEGKLFTPLVTKEADREKRVEEFRKGFFIRVHLEKYVNRFKGFGIFKRMPISLVQCVDHVATVVAGLCNFMPA